MAGPGFSRLDALGILAVLLACLCILGVFWPIAHRSTLNAQRLRDASQLRNIVHAVQQFSQSNRDRWIPTWDPDAPDAAWAVNTTDNLYAQFVFQQLLIPDMLVSPAEKGPAVGPGGRIPSSYAHQQPTEARAPLLSNTYSPSQMWFATRFPEVVGVTDRETSTITTPPRNPRSFALQMFSPTDVWFGNVANADGHVVFVTDWLQSGVTAVASVGTYATSDGHIRPDLPWMDEPDDAAGTNDFLGIFETAGRHRADFAAVYD